MNINSFIEALKTSPDIKKLIEANIIKFDLTVNETNLISRVAFIGSLPTFNQVKTLDKAIKQISCEKYPKHLHKIQYIQSKINQEQIAFFIESFLFDKHNIKPADWYMSENMPSKIFIIRDDLLVNEIEKQINKTLQYLGFKVFSYQLVIDEDKIKRDQANAHEKMNVLSNYKFEKSNTDREKRENQIEEKFEVNKWDSLEDASNQKNKGKYFDLKAKFKKYNLKNGKKCFRFEFILFNETNALAAYFYLARQKDELASKLDKKFTKFNSIQVKGRTKISKNKFNGVEDLEFEIRNLHFIEETVLENETVREDDSNQKRIELNCHSQMTAMDGLIKCDQLIKTVSNWHWKAIAITDRNNVQSYPNIYNAKQKWDSNIKIIYGAEFELISEDLKIAKFPDQLIANNLSEYIVFDLETTGLNPFYSEIIEFGAIHIKDEKIISKEQFFIKPNNPIPKKITNITGITEADVKDGLLINAALDRIKKYIKNIPLVAHNGYEFDAKFLENLYWKKGWKFENPIIDTMNLARKYATKFNLKRFRLKNLALVFKVPYDEQSQAHRADYDCEVLYHCFTKMIKVLKEDGEDIKTIFTETDASEKREIYNRFFGNYVTVLAKNQEGLKRIYELVSLANTEQLYWRPKLFWKNLQKDRKNILVGSVAFKGEVYQAALNNHDDYLKELIKQFDYIGILPLSALTEITFNETLKTEEELAKFNQRIINIAESEKKIIIGSSDAYYLAPNDKEARKVFATIKGLGGSFHYLSNMQKTINDIPDNHLRTTTEMLEEFRFLENDGLAEQLIIHNPNKIADLISANIIPIKEGLFFAKIANDTKTKLNDLVNVNLIKKYNFKDKIPKIVQDRVDKELAAIIKHQFSDIYYIAYKIVSQSIKDGYLVGSRGSVGSSIIAHLINVTEVNPLPSHYLCNNCNYSDFDIDNQKFPCGYDLEPKPCPNCKSEMIGQGHNIPFETFLGFEGDKTPDIDLNFASSYQAKAHRFTKELFGEENVLRAGTISTIAEKTAFAQVSEYDRVFNLKKSRAQKEILAEKCTGTKRTTGQHPGGIIVFPKEQNMFDFTPYNYPADDIKSAWKTTHFAYEWLHDSLLKLDLLGHVDPEAIKMLERITAVDISKIPFYDKKVISLFNSPESLDANSVYTETKKVGSLGIPEFGTNFVMSMLETTKPQTFTELVQISGLSHGTDVWTNNAEMLITKHGKKLKDIISCRDDIMVELIAKNISPKQAFNIMERVRKGKGLSKANEILLKENNVPDWYIQACNKIKYMFPKAHATAYVIMAWRIAWFKIYYPLAYYATFFTTRCDQFDVETMIQDERSVISKVEELRKNTRKTPKETALLSTMHSVREMLARGFNFTQIDINHSDSHEFKINPDNKTLLIPFIALDGLGELLAKKIVEERTKAQFTSIDDFLNRCKPNKTIVVKLKRLSIL